MTTVRAARTLLVLAALTAFALVVLALGPLRREPDREGAVPVREEPQPAAAPEKAPARPQEQAQAGRAPQPSPALPSLPPPPASAPPASAPPEQIAAQAPQQQDAGPPAAAPAQSGAPVERAQPAPDKPALRAEAPADKADRPADTTPPAFDVVRVEPNGDTVIGGRAEPGSMVELLVDGQVRDRGVADGSGLFAMTPPRLGKGEHELFLRFTTPDGKQVLSRHAVSVSLDLVKPPLVALSAPDQPTVVLSGPGAGEAGPQAAPAPAPTGEAGDSARPVIAVATVEADRAGKLFVSGTAAPGATVRLYLNDAYLASTTAGADGRVAFTVGSGMQPGAYRVRLDDVDPVHGAVRSRAEVPFAAPADIGSSRPATAGAEAPKAAGKAAGEAQVAGEADADAAPSRTVTVAEGDTLWHISRRTYGLGGRYTVVYEANRKQIRNPDLIYPGQTFVLPDKRS